MKEEIRIDSKDLILKDNKVASAVLPQTTAQLGRTVIIEGNVEVYGAVYGEKVLIHDGPCEMRKAVFGKEELLIDPTSKGDIIFRESAGSNQVISSTSISGRVIFCSDLNAKRITLRNCFVGGCVYADDIQLDNCVVIGGVFASKKLEINNSIVGTFNSQEVLLDGTDYLLYPSAFSVEPIKPTATAKLFNITLADLMDLYKCDPEKEYTGLIEMDIQSKPQKANLKADDGTILLVHSYSVAGKVLVADLDDFRKLDNHFLVNAGALSSQLLRAYDVKNSKGETIPLEITRIRDFFFSILSGSIQIRAIEGSIDFEALKKKFGA